MKINEIENERYSDEEVEGKNHVMRLNGSTTPHRVNPFQLILELLNISTI